MDLFQISIIRYNGRSTIASYLTMTANVAVNLAFYLALAFVIGYGATKGIAYAR